MINLSDKIISQKDIYENNSNTFYKNLPKSDSIFSRGTSIELDNDNKQISFNEDMTNFV